ncbi:MAG: ribonuclease P protein subunit [Nanoarchaeota archaeon]
MVQRNIFPHELIGTMIEVIQSTNLSQVGMKGKIIDETKQTITIQKADGQDAVLLKNTITFKVSATGEIISGKEIIKRPEERLKGR